MDIILKNNSNLSSIISAPSEDFNALVQYGSAYISALPSLGNLFLEFGLKGFTEKLRKREELLH